MTKILCQLFLAIFLVVPAVAMDSEEIEKIIKEYIQNHPEEVDQSLRKYYREKRLKQEGAKAGDIFNHRYDVPIDDAMIKGHKTAPIQIVEFSDFQCPFCSRSVATFKQIEQKYKDKVLFAFKHYPLEKIHPLARAASRAGLAAGEQGKFWEYHNLLMERQDKWKIGDQEIHFSSYALELGLNVDKFKMDYTLRKDYYNGVIDKDISLGHKLGVKGTPTFFINGVKVRGAREAEYISSVIERLLVEKVEK